MQNVANDKSKSRQRTAPHRNGKLERDLYLLSKSNSITPGS